MTNLAPTATAEAQADVSKAQSKARRSMVILYVVLTLLLLIYSLPTIGVLLTSLKTNVEISREGVWNLPDSLSLGNYRSAIQEGNVGRYILNSLKVTVPACVLSIAFGILTGYTLAKLSFRGSDILFVFLVSGLFFPPQIVMIPLFRMFNSAGLYDTLWPMIIVHAGFGIPICTLVLKNFFATIPTAIRGLPRTRCRCWCASCCPCRCPRWRCWRLSVHLDAGTISCGRSFSPARTTLRTVMFDWRCCAGDSGGLRHALIDGDLYPDAADLHFFQKYFIPDVGLGEGMIAASTP